MYKESYYTSNTYILKMLYDTPWIYRLYVSIFDSQIHLNLIEEDGVRRGEKENEGRGRRRKKEERRKM